MYTLLYLIIAHLYISVTPISENSKTINKWKQEKMVRQKESVEMLHEMAAPLIRALRQHRGFVNKHVGPCSVVITIEGEVIMNCGDVKTSSESHKKKRNRKTKRYQRAMQKNYEQQLEAVNSNNPMINTDVEFPEICTTIWNKLKTINSQAQSRFKQILLTELDKELAKYEKKITERNAPMLNNENDTNSDTNQGDTLKTEGNIRKLPSTNTGITPSPNVLPTSVIANADPPNKLVQQPIAEAINTGITPSPNVLPPSDISNAIPPINVAKQPIAEAINTGITPSTNVLPPSVIAIADPPNQLVQQPIAEAINTGITPSTNVLPPSAIANAVPSNNMAQQPIAEAKNIGITPSSNVLPPSDISNDISPINVAQQPIAEAINTGIAPSTNVLQPSDTANAISPINVAQQPIAEAINTGIAPSTNVLQPSDISNAIPPINVAQQAIAEAINTGIAPSTNVLQPSDTANAIPPINVAQQPIAEAINTEIAPSTNVLPPSDISNVAPPNNVVQQPIVELNSTGIAGPLNVSTHTDMVYPSSNIEEIHNDMGPPQPIVPPHKEDNTTQQKTSCVPAYLGPRVNGSSPVLIKLMDPSSNNAVRYVNVSQIFPSHLSLRKLKDDPLAESNLDIVNEDIKVRRLTIPGLREALEKMREKIRNKVGSNHNLQVCLHDVNGTRYFVPLINTKVPSVNKVISVNIALPSIYIPLGNMRKSLSNNALNLEVGVPASILSKLVPY